MKKPERYNWARPGDEGESCHIPIDRVLVDRKYQRGEASKYKTLYIASNFNWIAFGSIIVMRRQNGEIYVVDGQQRLLAAKHRGDIKDVPCLLFQSDGVEHEAKAFLALNTRRSSVASVEKFRASVMSKEEPESQINEWLIANGYKVVKFNDNPKNIDFPSKLVLSWKIDKEACKKALNLQVKINWNKALNSDIHMGLWKLLHGGVDVEKYAEKIIESGGKTAILRSITETALETGQAKTARISALGILKIINNRLRNRIQYPFAIETEEAA